VLSFSSIILLFAAPLLLRVLQHRKHRQQLHDHGQFNYPNVSQPSSWQLPTLEQVPPNAHHSPPAIASAAASNTPPLHPVRSTL